MKIKYFKDTDTLYIEFNTLAIAESKDLSENILLDFSSDGEVCAITVEHASDIIDKGGQYNGKSH